MTLRELIAKLEAVDPATKMRPGFGKSHSWRGAYEQVAFTPLSEATVGVMLMHAKAAVGSTLYGWKGGEYECTLDTECNVAAQGEYSGDRMDVWWAANAEVGPLRARVAELEAEIARPRAPSVLGEGTDAPDRYHSWVRDGMSELPGQEVHRCATCGVRVVYVPAEGRIRRVLCTPRAAPGAGDAGLRREAMRIACLLGNVPSVMWESLAVLESLPPAEVQARHLASARDTLLKALESLRALASPPGAPAPAAKTTLLRLLAAEHEVLRKVRLKETFTMEESQAASAAWHEADDVLRASASDEPSPDLLSAARKVVGVAEQKDVCGAIWIVPDAEFQALARAVDASPPGSETAPSEKP